MYKLSFVLLLIVVCSSAYSQKADPCKQIVVKTYPDQTISTTPVSEKVSFGRVVSSKDTIMFLTVKGTGHKLFTNAKGVRVLLDGGRVIEDLEAVIKPTGKKDASGAYIYEAMFMIERVQVVYLSIYPIAGYEMYVFPNELTDAEAKRIQKYAECIFQ